MLGEEVNLPERADEAGVHRTTIWRMVLMMQDELGLVINKHRCWQMADHADPDGITEQ